MLPTQNGGELIRTGPRQSLEPVADRGPQVGYWSPQEVTISKYGRITLATRHTSA